MENVEFLFSSKDCLLKGYCPCKVCKPLEPVKSMPLEIRKLLKEMESNPDLKINDRGLPIKSRLKCWETQWLSVQWPVPMG
ncbi:Ada metal-binding domain-containing protein [Arthrospiribacter ruber]|uniref:Uncharacterized protein n=1 Tax=Arthrospiribacter ruber TaxID=2487934 RepID=A0A951IUZ9_9BACT|nr:hypothetical protein [Arthrospiribacter ruber]MBW3469614.1 hypothetical protein [Arthrospiribacter ruber]MBW3470311.1 hypothetical protein [Arthrospiribacter ruber]